ncbi:MAG: M56 family metallopeptidase [Rhodobacteraceae bacterium]|nr:M56 family metallopeptidase [Paracoccaceae bacterium]
MTSASTLLNAYVEVNVLLVLAALAAWALTAGLRRAGLAHTVTAQLRLNRALLVAVLASPVAVALTGLLGESRWNPANTVNLTDFMVSQYLQGRVTMNAAAFESVVTLRSQLSQTAFTGLGAALLAALALGVGAALCRLVWGAWALHRVLQHSHLWRRVGRVELRVSDRVAVPFSTRTFRRRVIVIPSALLEREGDLRIALGHELQHLREGDVEWEVLICLLTPLFVWNPAFRLWKRWIEELRELSCDARVLARRHFDLRSYCDCLIRVCHDGLERRRLLSLNLPGVALVRAERGLFGATAATLLRQRMLSILEARRERHPTALFAGLAAPLVGLTLLAALSIRPPADWSQDRLMLSTIINLERLEAINGREAAAFGVRSW